MNDIEIKSEWDLVQTNTISGVFILESGSSYLSGDLLVYNDKNKSGFRAEFTTDIDSGSVRWFSSFKKIVSG